MGGQALDGGFSPQNISLDAEQQTWGDWIWEKVWGKPDPKKQEEPRRQEEADKGYVGIGIGLQKDPESWGKEATVPNAVHGVRPGSPAERAGMRQGDVITKIDGRDVRGMKSEDMAQYLAGKENVPVNFTVRRNGEDQQLQITPGRIKVEQQQQGGQRRGVTLEELFRGLGALVEQREQLMGRGGPRGMSGANGCPASPEYMQIIDVASQQMYDVKALGDIEELKHRYDCRIKTPEDVITYANKALAATGDKYNRVIAGSGPSPELPKNKEAGIGAAVGREHDKDGNETQTGPLMINDVVPNSPAEKAGLAPGDKIKAVNGTDVTRLPIDDAIMLVRGRANTDVTLTIIRDGKERDITITRQVVTPVDVTDKDLGDGIAYIRLHDFGDEKTVEAMRDALTKHDDADALVLDLRNNPGGRLDVVIDMLSMFVRDGKLLRVYARMGSPAEAPMYSEAEYSVKGSKVIDSQRPGGTGDPKVKDMSRMTYMVDGRPLVVLVNGLSASASEVFAGAVKDNKAAILVGDTTYGKGVGQSYLHLSPEVTLSVTSLRYTSPSGHWAGDANEDKRGITPHVSVTNPEGTRLGGKEDLQLQKAIEILKEQKKTPRGRNAIAA